MYQSETPLTPDLNAPNRPSPIVDLNAPNSLSLTPDLNTPNRIPSADRSAQVETVVMMGDAVVFRRYIPSSAVGLRFDMYDANYDR